MKIVSLFNNKGGVGKSTLAFHLSNILADLGHKTLMIDLDPQCNLTIFSMQERLLEEMWRKEDIFIDDYEAAISNTSPEEFTEIITTPRTIHFLLKPTEDGQGELPELPPPHRVRRNLDLVPGRLTVHKYESKIAERWSGSYLGDPLSIRTITRIRSLAEQLAAQFDYEFVIIDTSPSLGALNKVIISTVDGFVIPALPDMFSLYGIQNIGNALEEWSREFRAIYSLISTDKRSKFPSKFVQFLGYTIYNAKKYSNETPWDLALAHYNYAQQIPSTVQRYISEDVRRHLSDDQVSAPIGATAVMHSHNTLPNMAQKYKVPIWLVPNAPNLERRDKPTVSGNRRIYLDTKLAYTAFANSFLSRLSTLDSDEQ